MTDRLRSDVHVGALLRRVNDAGGMAVVLARGEAQDGALLIVTFNKGVFTGIYQREPQGQAAATLARIGPADSAEAQSITDFWHRRRQFDPDLWVIELDIASAERFAAETIL